LPYPARIHRSTDHLQEDKPELLAKHQGLSGEPFENREPTRRNKRHHQPKYTVVLGSASSMGPSKGIYPRGYLGGQMAMMGTMTVATVTATTALNTMMTRR